MQTSFFLLCLVLLFRRAAADAGDRVSLLLFPHLCSTFWSRFPTTRATLSKNCSAGNCGWSTTPSTVRWARVPQQGHKHTHTHARVRTYTETFRYFHAAACKCLITDTDSCCSRGGGGFSPTHLQQSHGPGRALCGTIHFLFFFFTRTAET